MSEVKHSIFSHLYSILLSKVQILFVIYVSHGLMTLFYSNRPQTFEVVKPQPACFANSGDALRFVGIITQNQVNSIKNLLPTYTVLVCTLRKSFLLKSD